MTHDELLAEIGDNTERTNNALCAVVDLHKPSEPVSDDNFICCETCNYEYQREWPYPCATIQAIEKELW